MTHTHAVLDVVQVGVYITNIAGHSCNLDLV